MRLNDDAEVGTNLDTTGPREHSVTHAGSRRLLPEMWAGATILVLVLLLLGMYNRVGDGVDVAAGMPM
jgi:hypothetical protein